MTAKLVVMYPRPRDIEAFEKIYYEEHVPMAIAKLAGKTKMVGTRILGSQQGTPPFTGSRSCTFLSTEVLEACAASEGGKQTIAHAVSISSGGALTILLAKDETVGAGERQ